MPAAMIFPTKVFAELVLAAGGSTFILSSLSELSSMMVPSVSPTSCTAVFHLEPVAGIISTAKLAPYEITTDSFRSWLERTR